MRVWPARLAMILLGLGPVCACAQDSENPDSPDHWLSGLIRSCARHRDAIVAADARNAKLFGNRQILADIDEKDLFADTWAYQAAVGAAGRWLHEQFPILKEAFTTEHVEACVNTGMVYLRGRAPELDFAAVVPMADVTCCEPHGPWSITFVRRENDRSDDLRALASQTEKEQSERLARFLSQFGEVAVEHAKAAHTETQPTGLRIEGEATFRQLKFSGRLTVLVSPFVTYIELSDLRGSGKGFAKPFIVRFQRGSEREPDWTGETNLRPMSRDDKQVGK